MEYERTAAEMLDPVVAWQRDDRAFFAAGACHILAWAFLRNRVSAGYDIVFLKPERGLPGAHVYVSDGLWAFDHGGWSAEVELLAETRASYRRAWAGWECQRLLITDDLDDFCAVNNHRRPDQYPHDPWPRAAAFLARLPGAPNREETV